MLDLGDAAGAERAQRDAVAGCRAALGDTNPETLITITHLAGLLRAQNKFSEAEPLCREVRTLPLTLTLTPSLSLSLSLSLTQTLTLNLALALNPHQAQRHADARKQRGKASVDSTALRLRHSGGSG